MEDPKGAVKVRLRTARKKLHDACRRIKGWIKENRPSERGKLYKSAEPEVAGPLQLLQCARQLEFVVAFLPLVSGLCIQMAEPARGKA